MSFKAAFLAGKSFATADNSVKGLGALMGFGIAFLSGLTFPMLAILRIAGGLGERFFLVPVRLLWSLAAQFLFFWTVKFFGFTFGIFSVDGLYKFYVFIDLVMAYQVIRILFKMIGDNPDYSWGTGKSWVIWNPLKRISWVSDSTIKLWVEPLFLLIMSLIIMRHFNGAIGA